MENVLLQVSSSSGQNVFKSESYIHILSHTHIGWQVLWWQVCPIKYFLDQNSIHLNYNWNCGFGVSITLFPLVHIITVQVFFLFCCYYCSKCSLCFSLVSLHHRHTARPFPRCNQYTFHFFPGCLWKGAGNWGPVQTVQRGRGGPEEATLDFLWFWCHSVSCRSRRSPAWAPWGVCLWWLLVWMV